MRKQLKLKKRSCKLCKPHKMSWENRWKVKERDRLFRDEKEMRLAKWVSYLNRIHND